MNKLSLLLAVASLGVVYTQDLATLGGYLGDFVQGTCAAMQEDPTDTTTDCYTYCSATDAAIVDMFTVSGYQSGTFNMGDFYNKLNIFLIKMQLHFDKCNYNNFLMVVDKRLSDYSFMAGMGANLGTQLAQYDTSAVYVAWNKISTNVGANNWNLVGQGVQLFLSNLFNFQAPRVKGSPKTW